MQAHIENDFKNKVGETFIEILGKVKTKSRLFPGFAIQSQESKLRNSHPKGLLLIPAILASSFFAYGVTRTSRN